MNGNQQWWTDTNANGRVEIDEIDNGDEWLRFDYARLAATQEQVSVGFPYTRSIGAGSGGVWAGASHYVRSAGDNRTTLTFDVTFYRHAAWPDVQVDASTINVPPHSTINVTATLLAPPDAAYGLHAGTLVVEDAGRLDLDPTFRPRDLNLPISWQVPPDPAVGAEIDDRAQGGFSWGGRGEEGDWHFYRFTLNDPPPGSILLAHTRWSDYPTDLDTLIFGPRVDSFSTIAPQWFGPYGLDLVGGSTRSGLRPSWNFQTVTGGTEEWVAAPAQPGTHVAAEQAVLLGGHQSEVPFTTSLGLAYVEPYPLRLDPLCGLTCTITATFHTTIDLTGTLALAHSYGWYTPTVYTDAAILPGESISYSVLISSSTYALDAVLSNVANATDLDLALYNDYGLTVGAWDPSDELVSTTYGPGVTKMLHIKGLLGQYWLVVKGQQVNPAGGSYDLEVGIVPADSDGGLIATALPDALNAGQPATLTLQTALQPLNGQRGEVVLNLAYLTNTLDVPIRVEPLSDLWVTQTLPTEVIPGRPFSVTLVFGNDGLSAAHDVVVSHTLWLDGETAITATQSVPQLSAGEVQTWTIGFEPPADLVSPEVKSILNINGLEFDPDRSNNVRSDVSVVQPQADVWVTTAGPTMARPGETITYTTQFGNAGPSDAHDVLLTDVLPPGMTVYQPATRHFDVLPAGALDNWVLTATVAVTVNPGITLTNQVFIVTADDDPVADNNVATSGFASPYRAYLPLVVKS